MTPPRLIIIAVLLVTAAWLAWDHGDETPRTHSRRHSTSQANSPPQPDGAASPPTRHSSKTSRPHAAQGGRRPKNNHTQILLKELFPNPDVILIKECREEVLPKRTEPNETTGAVHTWVIHGYASDNALDRLTVVNTREGIKTVLDAVYHQTGADRFRTDLRNRNLTVNLLASENRNWKPGRDGDETTRFPYLFQLTIFQRIAPDNSPPSPAPIPASQRGAN